MSSLELIQIELNILKDFKNYFYLCVCGLPLVCGCLWRPEEDVGSYGVGVKGS